MTLRRHAAHAAHAARAAGAVAAGLALAAVFLAYLNPHLARDLADRFWACF